MLAAMKKFDRKYHPNRWGNHVYIDPAIASYQDNADFSHHQ